MIKTKSLNDVYGPLNGSSNFSSTLLERCTTAWNKPIDELSVQELRLLIDQGIGLEEIMARALNLLEENPFLECEFYRGDLLKSVFEVSSDFWDKHNGLKTRLIELKFDIEKTVETYENEIKKLGDKFTF